MRTLRVAQCLEYGRKRRWGLLRLGFEMRAYYLVAIAESIHCVKLTYLLMHHTCTSFTLVVLPCSNVSVHHSNLPRWLDHHLETVFPFPTPKPGTIKERARSILTHGGNIIPFIHEIYVDTLAMTTWLCFSADGALGEIMVAGSNRDIQTRPQPLPFLCQQVLVIVQSTEALFQVNACCHPRRAHSVSSRRDSKQGNLGINKQFESNQAFGLDEIM
jgi:hypothetical protein